MRDPELVARAGYAAARLEQAWERWRALYGLGGSADPLASYVGYSLKEPMGQPRVVIGVDAAEAEFFADFLESHASSAAGVDSGLADASPAPGAGLGAGDSGPLNGMHPPVSGPMHPPVSGPQRVLANGSARPVGPAASGPLRTSPALGTGPMTGTGPLGPGPADAPGGPGTGPAASASRNGGPGAAPAPRDVPSAPMVRLMDRTDPAVRPGPRFEPAGPRFEPAGPLAAPVSTERPLAGPAASAPTPATSVFPAIPADPPGPLGAPIASLSPVAPNGHADHDGYQHRAGTLSPAEYPGPRDPAGSPEPPDAIAAEMAGWASGELPGQASEQLASWAAGNASGGRLRRSAR